ncbi:MAG: 50S ribosomal protein L25 [Clostridiales bacterium]|jgi:large subunit ribosomal protein L25|nr:50S ribosomal protein L25 [Clostridiales bacterium]
MSIFHADKRDMNLNARQLKKTGLIPGNIYGGDLDQSLLIHMQQNEVRQLLRSKTTGNKLTLSVDGRKYSVIIKEIGRSPVSGQIEHLSFQALVNSRMVTSAARIVLLNREKVSNFVQQRLFEIPYRAFPSNLVEEIEIDLEGMPLDTYVRVQDLDIAKNEDIELLVEPDDLVLSIVGSRKPVAENENEEEQTESA